MDIIAAVENSLERLLNDGIRGWAAVLATAEDCHRIPPQVSHNDKWALVPAVEAVRKEIEAQFGNPWRRDLTVDPSWANAVLDLVRRQQDPASQAICFLGAVKHGDDGLFEVLQPLAADPDPEQLTFLRSIEAHNLVLLPAKRFWPPPSDVSGALNHMFADSLHGVARTPVTVRCLSQHELGLVGTRQSGGPSVVLLVQPLSECDVSFVLNTRADADPIPGFSVVHRGETPRVSEVVEQLAEGMVSADIVVLPELTVGEHERERLVEAVVAAAPSNRDLLIVAGSGHWQLDNGAWVNSTTLVNRGMDGRSSLLTFSHLKSIGFRLRSEDVRANEENDAGSSSGRFETTLIEHLESAKSILERLDLHGGSLEHPLICADTPWGRLGLLICRDALGDDNLLLEALKVARIEHLFLPSCHYGSFSEFRFLSKRLVERGIGIYWLNSGETNDHGTEWFGKIPVPNWMNDEQKRLSSLGEVSEYLQLTPERIEIDLGRVVARLRALSATER